MRKMKKTKENCEETVKRIQLVELPPSNRSEWIRLFHLADRCLLCIFYHIKYYQDYFVSVCLCHLNHVILSIFSLSFCLSSRHIYVVFADHGIRNNEIYFNETFQIDFCGNNNGDAHIVEGFFGSPQKSHIYRSSLNHFYFQREFEEGNLLRQSTDHRSSQIRDGGHCGSHQTIAFLPLEYFTFNGFNGKTDERTSHTHSYIESLFVCFLNRKEDILLSPFTGLNLFSILEKKSRFTVQKQNVLKNASVTVRMHQYKERIEMKLEKMRLQ